MLKPLAPLPSPSRYRHRLRVNLLLVQLRRERIRRIDLQPLPFPDPIPFPSPHLSSVLRAPPTPPAHPLPHRPRRLPPPSRHIKHHQLWPLLFINLRSEQVEDLEQAFLDPGGVRVGVGCAVLGVVGADALSRVGGAEAARGHGGLWVMVGGGGDCWEGERG